MAFLFVDSLAENTNSRFVQISSKILEVLLLSMGLISTAVVMKEAVLPYSCEIVFSSLMGFWNSIRCFLSSPLSIIFTINLMVLLILASSAFHGGRHHHQHHDIITTLLDVDHDHDHDPLHLHDHDESPISIEPLPPQPQPPPSAPPLLDLVEVSIPPPTPRSDNTLRRTSWYDDVSSSTQQFATLPSSNKPSFLNHALIPKSHEVDKTQGKWKDVFTEKVEEKAPNQETMEEDNTMDATWEAIVGGGKLKPKPKLKPEPEPKPKPKPKKKAIKKSETWDAPPRRLDSEEVVPTSPTWRELRKAETFNDAVSAARRGGLIRRDPSMSLEEFNQKVERFINNFKFTLKRA